MQVATGKSVLNGIAVGKLKIYKHSVREISDATVTDTDAELERFYIAKDKAVEQQYALYEKAVVEAGEDIAEVFNIHALMLEDDDFIAAIKEIIVCQKKSAEYAVKTAGDNQSAVFGAMDDPYLQARSSDVIDIEQSLLDFLMGTDSLSMQGDEPFILVADDLAPSETVRLDKSLLLGFIIREGSTTATLLFLQGALTYPLLFRSKKLTIVGTEKRVSLMAITPAFMLSRQRICTKPLKSADRTI